MTHWTETYRGAVPPWQCDVTEHFTIAYYFDRLEEADTTSRTNSVSSKCNAAPTFPAGSMPASHVNFAPVPVFMSRARR